MSGYTEEEARKFNEEMNELNKNLTLLYPKVKKAKKPKRKRGLKKGEWKNR